MIHLDHAATGLPRCEPALAAAVDAATWTTPGRGLHARQALAAERVDRARAAVARLVVGGGTVCFSAGATAALNQAILGVALPTDGIVATGPMLHNAARRPVAALGRATWTLPHDRDGRIDVAAARASWPAAVRLVVVDHASNVTGLLQPVADLTEVAHARGAIVVVDAAQTGGVLAAIDVGDADLVVLSGHKGLRAMPGVGALLVRGMIDLTPRVLGGTGFEAEPEAMPTELPARLEAGTPNLPGIAAMAAAAEHDHATRWDARARALDLRSAIAAAGLRELGGGELPVVSFRIAGLEPTEVEELLDRVYDITVRAGLHCAFAAHETLQTLPRGTVRASAGATTTDAELEALSVALRELVGYGSGAGAVHG